MGDKKKKKKKVGKEYAEIIKEEEILAKKKIARMAECKHRDIYNNDEDSPLIYSCNNCPAQLDFAQLGDLNLYIKKIDQDTRFLINNAHIIKHIVSSDTNTASKEVDEITDIMSALIKNLIAAKKVSKILLKQKDKENKIKDKKKNNKSSFDNVYADEITVGMNKLAFDRSDKKGGKKEKDKEKKKKNKW